MERINRGRGQLGMSMRDIIFIFSAGMVFLIHFFLFTLTRTQLSRIVGNLQAVRKEGASTGGGANTGRRRILQRLEFYFNFQQQLAADAEPFSSNGRERPCV